jgi:hypothetical protein
MVMVPMHVYVPCLPPADLVGVRVEALGSTDPSVQVPRLADASSFAAAEVPPAVRRWSSDGNLLDSVAR